MKANTTISIASADGSRIEEIPAFFQRKQLNGFDAWTQLRTFDPAAPDFGKIMSTIAQLNGEALRVLLAILFSNGYRNRVTATQGALASLLGMQRQNVGRAFRALVDAGLLVEAEAEAGRKSWTLSEQIAWRGRGNEHLQRVK